MLNSIKRYFHPDTMVQQDRRLGSIPDRNTAYADFLRIALPSIAEMVLMSMIGSVDTIMVGQLGKNALAAVSLPGQPRMIMLSMFFALNVGVTTIVARRKGEDRRDAANLTLRNALMLVFALSIVVMLTVVSLAEPLIRLAGGNTNTPDDADVLDNAISYFTIMAYALPINAVSMCINAALRGVGNTKLTMQVNTISNLVNVVFNYLLIGGNLGFPKLEVPGAAIASVIGMTAGAMLSILTVLRGSSDSYLHLSRHDKWRIDKETMRGIFRVGGNAMVEQLSMRFGFFMYSRIMYGLGVTLFAAHNICMQFLGITFSFSDGLGIASTSLVGQNLGAKRPDLALLYGKIGQRLALVVSLAIASLTVLFRDPLTALFIDPASHNARLVLDSAEQTMLVVALMQPFQMNSVVLSGCLRGAGDNLYVASCMAICVSVIRPLMAFLAVYVFKMGLAMTWLLSLSEMGIRMFLYYRRFESGKWMTIRI
ncbi:MAG: MATE family efflux transporter [Christensenellales bacterium]